MRDAVIDRLLSDAEEEEELSALLGADLSVPFSRFEPPSYLPLDEWLRRSEEVHRFLQQTRRRERDAAAP